MEKTFYQWDLERALLNMRQPKEKIEEQGL
jgi:hypothetical protein